MYFAGWIALSKNSGAEQQKKHIFAFIGDKNTVHWFVKHIDIDLSQYHEWESVPSFGISIEKTLFLCILLIYQLEDKRMQENSPQGNFDYLSI